MRHNTSLLSNNCFFCFYLSFIWNGLDLVFILTPSICILYIWGIICSSIVKASSHIGDTTRHDSMRHDPFFRSPYNQMDQFTHMQHDHVWSSRQKAAAPKIALEAIFVVCRSDSIKKTAKENSFNRNLTRVYKFMTQEYSLKSQYLQLDVTQVVVL